MTLYYPEGVASHFGSYYSPSQWQWGLTAQDVHDQNVTGGKPLILKKDASGKTLVYNNHDSNYKPIPNPTVTASTTYPTGPNMTEALRQRSYADATPAKRAYMQGQGSDNSFWGNILDGFGNLAKQNPMAFITTPIDIWSAFANYRANKQALNMYQDQLNLQREAYEKNEARNQRRFEMLEQARATSQL